MVSPPSVRFNIVTVFNNSYLRTISKWNSISIDSREIIKKEYPEIEKLSEAYEKKKKDWEEYVKEGLERTNNILEGFNNRINTVSEVIEKVSTGIEWGLAVYTIGSTIICPPVGGAVALATGGTVLTRKAVAKVLQKLGGIIGTEIAKDLGQEHKELQNKLNTFFKKHNSNNSNNRNNNRGSNNNNNPEPKVRTQNTHEDVLKYWKELKNKGVIGKMFPYEGGRKGVFVKKDYVYEGTHGKIELKKGNILGRDNTHHEIEWFKDKNHHLGAFDPKTGLMTDKGLPGRKVKGI